MAHHSNYKDVFERVGIAVPEIFLPSNSVDMSRFAVIACDQFSSQPEYWEKAAQLAEGHPSTLNLIFPECYLEKIDRKEKIDSINKEMNRYLENQILESKGNFFVLVRRETGIAPVRWGLVAALDLDKYDFGQGKKPMIRATEGTILERIPPRVEIRKNAPLEFPHIMVLIDDKKKTIIEKLASMSKKMETLYDFQLMLGSGTITGYKVESDEAMALIADGFEALFERETMEESQTPLLFAVGDGNHSLATAKTIWEETKKSLSAEQQKKHPARFALVELNNIYDKGIIFEPIHRILEGTTPLKVIQALEKVHKIKVKKISQKGLTKITHALPKNQFVGLSDGFTHYKVEINDPQFNVTSATIQAFLDLYIKNNRVQIDYIHGVSDTLELSKKEDRCGVFLPNIDKKTFFKTIKKDGAFARKTFSMGEAVEKRFYIEGRKIR